MLVKFLAFVLRAYSFVFHLTLSVFLLGAAGIAIGRHESLSLSVLPFADADAMRNVILLGIFGLLCSLAALTRFFKFVFVLWSGLILYIMFTGFFMGPYSVSGTQEAKGAAWLTFGALGAFLGAVWGFKVRRRTGFF